MESKNKTPTESPMPYVIEFFREALRSAGGRGEDVLRVCREYSRSAFEGAPYECAAHTIFARVASSVPPHQSAGIDRALIVAALSEELPARLGMLSLTEPVLALYDAEIDKIRTHWGRGGEDVYPSVTDDSYIKDVRTMLALSLPCGAQSVEVDDSVKLRSLIKHAVVTADATPLLRLSRAALTMTWYGIHTDSRDLTQFNEAGWRACYLRIGELLRKNCQVAGVVGTSWFFDPQLERISPRLTYLRTMPMSGGALLIRNGPGDIHTHRATATSESRRALYRKGRYLPTCYTILWPRAELLRWCEQNASKA